MIKSIYTLIFIICLIFADFQGMSQNPLIMDQFTADPSAHVFEGKVYVYPSHDIPCKAGQGFIGFCMADYHVYSSDNLTEWKDHGVILSQEQIPWVDPKTFSMWAPDCIEKDGKYYYFFPAISNEKPGKRRIGVAIASNPGGPFKAEPSFIEGMEGIDPSPFIDKDGQAYIYWGSRDDLFMAKLKDNLLELASEPQRITGISDKFKEGPYFFERNGTYYLTFPHKVGKTERLDYAIAQNPMGPFKYMGIIMDESPSGCWTNHQSIVQYNNQWFLFYHDNDLSPEFDKNRSIKADSLFFNTDGSIQKVTPSLRGIGLTDPSKKVQIDRYSQLSQQGASISYLDQANKPMGWKTTFTAPGAWIRYNGVDFNRKFRHIAINAQSDADGMVEIRTSSVNGPLVSKIKIDNTGAWKELSSKIKNSPKGKQDLFIILKEGKNIDINWISFR